MDVCCRFATNNVVTGEGFGRYSNMLNPSYSVPCRATVAHQVQLLYKEGKEELISELNSLPVSMNQVWPSWLHNHHHPLHLRMGAEGVGPGHACARGQVYCRQPGQSHSWHQGGVQDSTFSHNNKQWANMVCASQKARIPRVPCLPHLATAVADGLKKPQIQKALASCRWLVSKPIKKKKNA